MEMIEAYCETVFGMLNAAGRKGGGYREASENLKDMGRLLCDDLLSPRIKKELAHTDETHLLVETDDLLVRIPWELICLGDEFLCQRFSTGREVSTRQEISGGIGRKQSFPLKMWILANPGGNLAEAEAEGDALADLCDRINSTTRENRVIADLTSEISPERVREKIRNYDFFHFAGHLHYDSRNPEQSGWVFKDGILSAGEVAKMAGGLKRPRLVFSNACQSACTGNWGYGDEADVFFGLVNAFLLAGAEHYIGTSWEIRDESAGRFGLRFYNRLFSGKSVGESLRLARQESINKDDDLCWAGYILYGDPRILYFGESAISAGNAEKEIRVTGKASAGSARTNGQTKGRAREGASPRIKANETSIPPKASRYLFWESRRKIRFIFVSVLLALVMTAGLICYFQWKIKPDDWTSVPLRMAVVFDPDGFEADAEDMISAAIEIRLMEYSRVKLVDRMELKRSLDEMELNASDWMDSEKRLQSGRGLPANLRLDVGVTRFGPEPGVRMRLVENETGRYIDVYSNTWDAEASVVGQGNALSDALLEKLKALYPLRGRILDISDSGIQLNIGSDVGVGMGQKFRVVNGEAVTGDVVLHVVSVAENSSTAEMAGGKSELRKGERLEAVTSPPSR